jgi:hypothetical protein
MMMSFLFSVLFILLLKVMLPHAGFDCAWEACGFVISKLHLAHCRNSSWATTYLRCDRVSSLYGRGFDHWIAKIPSRE